MLKLKLIAITLSFSMFCIQFKTAIESLISPPEIDSSSIQSIEDVDLPIITVCPTNQTNLTALELFGYNGRYNLHSGHGNSWGKLFNLTFEELKKDISDVEFAKSVKYYDYQLDQNSKVDLFYLPYHGYCREITRFIPTNNIW